MYDGYVLFIIFMCRRRFINYRKPVLSNPKALLQPAEGLLFLYRLTIKGKLQTIMRFSDENEEEFFTRCN